MLLCAHELIQSDKDHGPGPTLVFGKIIHFLLNSFGNSISVHCYGSIKGKFDDKILNYRDVLWRSPTMKGFEPGDLNDSDSYKQRVTSGAGTMLLRV